MGLIKEPKGIDFFVDPRPLSDEERRALSAFIKADKIKNSTISKKRKVSKRKTTTV